MKKQTLFNAIFGVVLVILLSFLPGFINYSEKNVAPKPDLQAEALFKKYNLDKIKLPVGFSIEVFAEVPNARSLTLSPNGTLFVGNRNDNGNVYALPDANKDGKPDEVIKIAEKLNQPNGVAFKDGDLYVAEINRILRFKNIESNLKNSPSYEVVYDKYPTDKHHGWKFIAFGPDGKLYVPVGAPCNICERLDNPVYSSITRLDVDTKKMEIFAEGIRNSVGFTWHPQTKELWFTSNGRDMLGDNTPPDVLGNAPTKGLHFGYPYCHAGEITDPEFGSKRPCSDFAPTAQKLQAHTAALGLRFYTGKMFPKEYQNRIFIAEHGSWNRTKEAGHVGYRITMVTLDSNKKPVKYEPFATGWLQPDQKVLGRPVDVQLMPDGSMLVSDDQAGVVYRITYKK
jgi:glucose/arabinose dehydrogenase